MYTYKYSPNGMGKFTITISSQKWLRVKGEIQRKVLIGKHQLLITF